MSTLTSADPATEAAPARRGPATRSGGKSLVDGTLNVFSHAFLLVWGLLTALPLLWAVLSAFKSDNEILSDPWGLPGSLRWDNFSRAWTHGHIGQYFVNTGIVLAGSLTLTMLLGATAAYALARYQFWGNRIIYFAFVGGMMFPVVLAFVPLFFVVRDAGMLDTLPGLMLVYTAYSLPFTVFFLTAFFRTLPTAVSEAALIDGCGPFRLFFRVMLPMAKPGLISVGIFNFLAHWNQYLLPVVLLKDENKYVLAQGLAALAVSEGYRGDYSRLFAGLTLAMLPVLVVYAVFQRQIQAGLTAGQMK
ncbi:MAG: carbohydrate ABC transporter permease [Hamadaea sp.]|nr:carbohydrate ABC transporter permease [Hamadaea sp.]NUR47535.1 carbohydrate ABC transporter permease [Hamadaea sp.]NUT06173.1 carbohydrate ABC transporter permease [Hamadaea sp.]